MEKAYFPNIDEDKYSAGLENEFEDAIGSLKYTGNALDQTVNQLRSYLTESYPQLFQDTLSDTLSRKRIQELISQYVKEKSIKINGIDGLRNTIETINAEILDFGVITDYINDEEIEEIRINSYKDIRIVISGREYKSERVFSNEETAINISKKIVRTVGKNLSASSPIIDARIKNGQRVACIINPLALSGINLTIRKQKHRVFTAEDLMKAGTLSEDMVKFLEIVGASEISCMIVGPTNSGKTATMQSLIHRLAIRNKDRRIITMEDTAELNLDNVISWETRNGIGLLELLIHSLRQSPQTLVLGEMRGKEAQTVVAAANTGHQVYNTFHASGPSQAPKRILQMYMMGETTLTQSMILEMIVDAFPICIYQKKLKDGSRKVMSISEIIEIEGNNIIYNDIFRFIPTGLKEKEIMCKFNDTKERINEILGDHVFYKPISKNLYDKLLEAGVTKKDLEIYTGVGPYAE